jgi:hypothetical protein
MFQQAPVILSTLRLLQTSLPHLSASGGMLLPKMKPLNHLTVIVRVLSELLCCFYFQSEVSQSFGAFAPSAFQSRPGQHQCVPCAFLPGLNFGPVTAMPEAVFL